MLRNKRSAVYLSNVVLILVLNIFPFTINAGTVIHCCNYGINHVSAAVAENESGVAKHKVNYRVPYREYIHEQGQWDVYVGSSLRTGNKGLYDSSLIKINKVLNDIFSILPANATEKLSGLKFFILRGENSSLGGRKNSMSYIRKGETNNYSYLDRRWEQALVIYSADNLKYLDELWSKKAMMHELAHAWHIANWPEKHSPIHAAWQNARDSGLFLNVQDVKGKTLKSAYARTNQSEYFAELSAIYFVGGNYYPYDRAQLKKYDPVGYKMVEDIWK